MEESNLAGLARATRPQVLSALNLTATSRANKDGINLVPPNLRISRSSAMDALRSYLDTHPEAGVGSLVCLGARPAPAAPPGFQQRAEHVAPTMWPRPCGPDHVAPTMWPRIPKSVCHRASGAPPAAPMKPVHAQSYRKTLITQPFAAARAPTPIPKPGPECRRHRNPSPKTSPLASLHLQLQQPRPNAATSPAAAPDTQPATPTRERNPQPETLT
jgi:hypothetical protein